MENGRITTYQASYVTVRWYTSLISFRSAFQRVTCPFRGFSNRVVVDLWHFRRGKNRRTSVGVLTRRDGLFEDLYKLHRVRMHFFRISCVRSTFGTFFSGSFVVTLGFSRATDRLIPHEQFCTWPAPWTFIQPPRRYQNGVWPRFR